MSGESTISATLLLIIDVCDIVLELNVSQEESLGSLDPPLNIRSPISAWSCSRFPPIKLFPCSGGSVSGSLETLLFVTHAG